jgi:integrase
VAAAARHLPWETHDGALVSVRLLLSTRERTALQRNYLNRHVWKPTLAAAGVEDSRENGVHALRHFFASVLLDADESIRALSEYLGHSDPGVTLRTYTPHAVERGQDAARDRRHVRWRCSSR